MTEPLSFAISARWRNRRPTMQESARRFDALIEALSSVHPDFRIGWFWIKKGDGVPYEAIRGTLASAIEAGKATDDNGTPWPDGGCRLTVLNRWDEAGPLPSVEISLSEGWLVPYFWANVLVISTPVACVSDPSIYSYEVIRAAMLAGCEIFEADSCIAYPHALADLDEPETDFDEPEIDFGEPETDLDEPGACGIGWMTYIGPEPAPLITPPSNVIVEHRPNGGLFMAATRDRFDVDDPAHVAAARAILAAVRPFNEWAVAMGYR